jgi:hypothetical protein
MFKYRKYIKIAKKNNLYFKLKDFNLEILSEILKPFELYSWGTEGFIFKYKNICRKVFKRQSNFFLNNILVHNKIFDNKIEIVGIIKYKRQYILIADSAFIDGRVPSEEEMKKELPEYLVSKGFEITPKGIFYRKLKLYIIHLTNLNVLKSNNKLYVIDEGYIHNKLIYKIFSEKLYFRLKLKF